LAELPAARLAEVMELVKEVAFRKLDTRLARLLIQRGPVVNATHQNLADELGSVRVFISRLPANFEQRGWVRLERGRVTVVEPKALLEFAQQ
jgi:CRP/FNR family transcriptional regulator